MVQSSIQLQRCYQYRSRVPENLVKKLSPKTPISQNLQPKHSEDILLLLAEYSNMSNIIKNHNSKVLANSSEAADTRSDVKTCNCRKSAACPLEGNCLANSVIYQATISCNSKNTQHFRYIGLTEGTFKTRYNGHLNSIRHEKNEAATELSKKFWELKRDGKQPSITWKIVKKVRTYKGGQSVCNLCLAEKYFIIRDRGKNLLNSRTELLSKCRHRKKFLLNRALS